ncbi:hypothetical protein HDU76_009869 [Blyttiomyces sp. JEL0837]|nr:hypothetical protein HDU76_009869 [Blyttiomyces sp. JEL0837]
MASITTSEQLQALVSEDGHNTLPVYCPRPSCKSKVLQAKVAHKSTLDTKIDLPLITTTGNEQPTPEFYWEVNDMMAFENVAFSHTLPGTGHRLLACADCETGPIGIQPEGKPNVFLICPDRVKYTVTAA